MLPDNGYVELCSPENLLIAHQRARKGKTRKEYVIEFNNESGLRVGASAAKTKLRADLKAVREKIGLARQAVTDVLKAAKAL